MKKAVILISGGLDSATCAAIARHQGYICYALSFDYGQRHKVELEAAKRIAASIHCEQHQIITLGIGKLGGSALTDSKIEVPHQTSDYQIPVTYVPARNTIFLSIAVGWAEVIGALDIFCGISAVDYSHYPDCRPEYLTAFSKMAQLATGIAVESGQLMQFHAPLLYLTKAETIQLGVRLGVDYAQTISCYQASTDGLACGKCASCIIRARAFQQAQIADPTQYWE